MKIFWEIIDKMLTRVALFKALSNPSLGLKWDKCKSNGLEHHSIEPKHSLKYVKVRKLTSLVIW